MANGEKHMVRFWRGTRESYNILANANVLDYWTRYSVKEPSGLWSEYFGSNLISEASGQLLPVIDIVEQAPSSYQPGDRYIVGPDIDGGYKIYESSIEQTETGEHVQKIINRPFVEGMSVRVKNKGYMAFQLVNGEMTTYDEVDCGTY